MALKEHKEFRSEERIGNELFKGVNHTRVFTCPKGEVDDFLASTGTLAVGSILPDAYRKTPRSATANTALQPRLQTVTRQQQKQGAMDRLVCVYVEVFERST